MNLANVRFVELARQFGQVPDHLPFLGERIGDLSLVDKTMWRGSDDHLSGTRLFGHPGFTFGKQKTAYP